MKRREFITLLGGAAAAWPLTARAQQREQVRRVVANDPGGLSEAAALKQGLQELGWIDGRNLKRAAQITASLGRTK
jgi:putative ABC transport system substrate-binding protein